MRPLIRVFALELEDLGVLRGLRDSYRVELLEELFPHREARCRKLPMSSPGSKP